MGVAVQFFRDTPAASRYLIRQKDLKLNVEAMAWFLELMSNWCTIMSLQHPPIAPSLQNMDKCHSAIGPHKLVIETIQGMKAGGTAQWKQFQARLLVATVVVVQRHDNLLKSKGYEYFLTRRIFQGCLKNVFSVICLRKPAPNEDDMKCALKLVCITQFLYTPMTTSYNANKGLYLVDLLSNCLQKHAKAEAAPIVDAKIPYIEELPSADCGILFHIGRVL